MRPVYTRLVLGFGLSLLAPAAAFAQGPAALPAAATPQVQIRVEFVTASAVDVDNLGLVLDRVPFPLPAVKPPPGGTFLQVLSGGLVPQLYQTLVRTRGKIVEAPLAITPNGVTATIRIDKQVSFDVRGPQMSGGPAPSPQTIQLHLLTSLLITPRINSDGSVTLNLAPQIGNVNATATGPHVASLRTVPNGGMLVVAGLPISGEKRADDLELLTFITPTIVGVGAERAEAGLPEPLLPAGLVCHVFHERGFSLDTSAGDLRAVVTMLGRQADIKTLVQDSDSAYEPVYVHLADASLAKALQAIAASAGAKVSQNAAGVYVFSPLPGEVGTPKAPVGDGAMVIVTP